MNILSFILLAWRDAAIRFYSFKGRTSRGAYFATAGLLLFYALIFPIAVIIWHVINESALSTWFYDRLTREWFFSALVAIALLLPITSRRFHDFDASFVRGMFPFGFLSPIHWIINFFRLFKKGDPHENMFGEPHTLKKRRPKIDPRQIG